MGGWGDFSFHIINTTCYCTWYYRFREEGFLNVSNLKMLLVFVTNLLFVTFENISRDAYRYLYLFK